MDDEIIAEHAEGIIATTGCPSGEVQTRLRLGHDREALEAAAKWREIFGPDNFFLELMDHGLSIERRVREGLLEIGQQARHPAAGDQRLPLRHQGRRAQPRGAAVHPDRQDAVGSQPVQVRRRRLLPEVRRRDAGDLGRRGARRLRLDAAHRRARAVLRRRLGAAATGCRSSRCPTGTTRSPGCGTRSTPGWPAASRQACRRSTSTAPTTRSRSSARRAIPAYFLVVADLINYARSVDIRVGPGRGSAAGSLVAYALGITNIDPIQHGLLFERFLNPERASMPDIDIDFDDRRRGEMVRYATDKWGSDRVAQVITFGTIKTKAAIKDSARVHYGQPGFAIADRITKALPPPIMAKDIPLSGITDPTHERYKEAAEVRGADRHRPRRRAASTRPRAASRA